MFQFIHAADIHLDSPLCGLEQYEGAPVDELRGATRQAFENLVALAIEREVAFVVIAGDLYDGDWKDYNTALFFNAQMSRLRESGIRVFLAAGNHDAASIMTKRLRSPENVTFFPTDHPETFILEDLGVAIHGQGYPARAVTDDLAANYPEAVPDSLNIGLLHTSVDGRIGHEPYSPCSVDGLLRKGYHYWALGHVHAREVLHENPWIVFPGNLQGRNVRETGAKGCTVVTADGERIYSVEHEEVDVIRWAVCEVDAREAKEAEEVVEGTRAELARLLDSCSGRPLAARVRITGASQAHGVLVTRPERWANEIRTAATDLGDAWVEKVLFETRPVADLDEMRTRNDVIGSLLRSLDRMRGHDDDELQILWNEFQMLRRALPPEVLERIDALGTAEPENLRTVLDDVRNLLVVRLLPGRRTR